MMVTCIFEQKIRDVPLDISKLPRALEVGWYTFKTCPITISREERKRVAWESFDGYMHGNNMEGLCRTIAEITFGNEEREKDNANVVKSLIKWIQQQQHLSSTYK